MNREIKFRFWRGNQPVDANVMVIHNGKACVRDTKTNDLLEVTDVVVEQYTGLNDSNGQEIYEGDIVKWDDGSEGEYWRIATVEWDTCGQWCFVVKAGVSINCFENEDHVFGMGDFMYALDANMYGNQLFVIGNIHENPELLEKDNTDG